MKRVWAGFRGALLMLLALQAPRAWALDDFAPCSEAFKDPAFAPLQRWVSGQAQKAQFCQQLSGGRFLYFDDDAFSVLRECAPGVDQALTCQEVYDLYPNLRVLVRHVGANGDRFVLFKTHRVSKGVYSERYDIFHRVPENVNPDGYQVYSLEGAGALHGPQTMGAALCEGMQDFRTAIVPRAPQGQVLAKKDSLSVLFNQTHIACPDQQVRAEQTLEFTWRSGRFWLTRDVRVLQGR